MLVQNNHQTQQNTKRTVFLSATGKFYCMNFKFQISKHNAQIVFSDGGKFLWMKLTDSNGDRKWNFWVMNFSGLMIWREGISPCWWGKFIWLWHKFLSWSESREILPWSREILNSEKFQKSLIMFLGYTIIFCMLCLVCTFLEMTGMKLPEIHREI